MKTRTMAGSDRVLAHYAPPLTPLDILFEDDHVLALNKPSGLLSVPGKLESHKDCLATRAQTYHAEARIVHRLDMETSGVVVFAKSAEALRRMGKQFEQRKTSKRYVAVVGGIPAATTGSVDLPLICDWPNRPKQMVDLDRGKPAQTGYEVDETRADSARLILTPITGRSHQLRVHMKMLGHPILGDSLYAPQDIIAKSPRLMLHAEQLIIRHPFDGHMMTFTADAGF